MKLKTAFAYIVYGDSIEYFNEAVYSIATLRQHNPDHPVLILTDHPDRLPSLPFISLVPIDKAML